VTAGHYAGATSAGRCVVVLEFRVLGPLEVVRDGDRVAVAAARERAVLAALALQPNRLVPAARLIALL
jgi:DNA-binding SARP family transcriptional activator